MALRHQVIVLRRVSKRPCPPPCHRSRVVGVAVEAMVGLALGVARGETGDSNLLASQGIPSVLGVEK